jgi:hypothetical protein
MTSRERAELLAEGFGGWNQSAIETVRMAIDAAVAEAVTVEREACIETLRPDYPDAVRMLVMRRGAK